MEYMHADFTGQDVFIRNRSRPVTQPSRGGGSGKNDEEIASHSSDGLFHLELCPPASVCFPTTAVGYASGNVGYIMKTSDGGTTWIQQTSTVSLALHSLSFSTDRSGLAVGDLGTLVGTAVGGAITSVRHEKAEIPSTAILEQNYPNPFNPTTHIGFRVIDREFVSLKVFDVLGREVATLVNEERPPGFYTVTWDARTVASGVYFCRLSAGSNLKVRKLLLAK